jgi:hypothetical protein
MDRSALAHGMAIMEYSTTASIALTEQFLTWVAAGPRTYGEVMEAWRSTCPHLSIWEDAVQDGLVRLENGGAMMSSRVLLTPAGQARLTESRA